MKRTYDNHGADRLIPLLRSVQREIRERTVAIVRLNARLARLPRSRRGEPVYLLAQADLATHKLEIRLAQKELERLGCTVDETRPERVLIPGASGELADGYAWSFGDTRVQALVAEQQI